MPTEDKNQGGQHGVPPQPGTSQQSGGGSAEPDSNSKGHELAKHLQGKYDTALKELSDLKAKVTEKETEDAKSRGQYEKLYTEEKTKRETVEQQFARTVKINALLHEGHKLGLIDADTLNLIDLGSVAVEGGSVKNAPDVMAEFKKAKPYLFGHPNPKTETATTKPAIPGGTNTAKLSGPVRSVNEVHAMTSDQKKQLVSEVYGNGALGGGFFRK